MKERLVWIDWSKTILIYLVIVGHYYAETPSSVHDYIYNFHMPAFFIVSGFLYKPRPVIKSILSFLIPIVFFSLIHLMYLLMREDTTCVEILSNNTIFGLRLDRSTYLMGGYWFLVVLLIIRIVSGDFIKNSNRILLSIGCCCFFATILSSQFGLLFGRAYIPYRVLNCMPFFVLGKLLNDLNIMAKINNIIAIILFVVGLFIMIINGKSDMLEFKFGMDYSLTFISASSITVSSFFFVSKLRINSFIVTISKGTLLVLGLHMMMLNLVHPYLSNWTGGISFIVIPLFILVICYYLINLSLRFCPYIIGKL